MTAAFSPKKSKFIRVVYFSRSFVVSQRTEKENPSQRTVFNKKNQIPIEITSKTKWTLPSFQRMTSLINTKICVSFLCRTFLLVFCSQIRLLRQYSPLLSFCLFLYLVLSIMVAHNLLNRQLYLVDSDKCRDKYKI